MSFAQPQQVGGRVQFSTFQQQAQDRFARDNGLLGNRRTADSDFPARTSIRQRVRFDNAPVSNPFAPRSDRGAAAAAGSHALTRRSATIGAAAGRRSRGGLTIGMDTAEDAYISGMATLSGRAGHSRRDYGDIGGVGAWPVSDSQGSNLGVFAGDSTRAHLSRPRSPAPRSASPHQSSKKLPSFLLGSAQPLKSPGTATSAFAPDSALSSIPVTANSTLSIANSARPSITMPLSSRPMSPRTSRRLSGFGSNDMLSAAYSSTAAGAGSGLLPSARGAAALDDAPPIMTLDEIDMPKEDAFICSDNRPAHSSSMRMGTEDPFAMHSAGGTDTGTANIESTENDKDYSDVKIRSVVVSGLPDETENSTLNFFRGLGEILAFEVVSSLSTNSLAILYSEPWQAQRAIGIADDSGRVLLAGRTLLRVALADEASVNLLFAQVFPGRPMPNSGSSPAKESMTLSETLYSKSPRVTQSPAQPLADKSGFSNVPSTSASMASRGVSPFRTAPSPRPFGASEGTTTTMASAGSVFKSQPAPKARNGLLQSAIDILFGW
ncbi:hypothetical protein FB645_000231 [Coemansia sp. IMI 203386]|nr:hypothetical protein FB645_000231 [Coemansia sp. IMI 203386]